MSQPNQNQWFVLSVCDFVRANVLRFGVVLAAVLLVASMFAPSARGQYCRPENATRGFNPEGLPVVAQAGISGAIGRDQPVYHATVGQNIARMETPARALRAEFSSRRVNFQVGAHIWRMSFIGYGYRDKIQRLGSVPPDVEANRVEYHRGMLTEWYVNGPLGVEQGFTLTGAPAQSKGLPLTFVFNFSGDLKPVETADRQALTLEDHESVALRYSGLTAMDASGRELRTWLELESNRLRLLVDDTDAKYPIAVDPILQAPATGLIACDGAANDQFGLSMAVSGDGTTVVVGAPNASISTGSTQAFGAAYVFLKPESFINRGWNSLTPIDAVAKLISHNDNSSTCAPGQTEGLCNVLGGPIAMSGDGSTIVVGDRQTIFPPMDEGGPFSFGIALVFLRPANGWASASPLTEDAELGTADEDGALSFGSSIGISTDGATVVGGSPGATGGEGAVYVFTEPANGWGSSPFPTQTARLAASDGPANLGYSVAVSGDGSTIVAGGPLPPLFNTTYPGAAYVFAKPSNGWANASSFAAKLMASNGVGLDGLGYSVSASGDGSTIVVGAPIDDFPSSTKGHAYVFSEPAGGWTGPAPLNETVELESSDGAAGDHFGYRVGTSADGRTIAVGAYTANSNQGAAYVFAEPGNGWSGSSPLAESVKLAVSNGAAGDQFGKSVGISSDGTVIVTGAPDAMPGSNQQQGVGYVFTGTFRYPIASPSPVAGLSFSGPVGVSSASQTVTLTNVGTATLHISDVEIAGLCMLGSCNLPFTSTKNCVGALLPGSQCSESVSFDPTSTGSFNASLAFSDDGADSSGGQSVPLSGTANQAGTTASITLLPDPALVGQPVTVTYSVVPPIGDTLTPSGTVTVNAAGGGSCTGSAPSGSCMLTFSSAVTRGITAGYSGDTNFISSISSSEAEQVVDFSLSLSPLSETISPGHLGSYALTLASVNGFVGTISLACDTAPPHSSCSVSPGSVTLSGSAQTATATINLENKGTYVLTFLANTGPLQHSGSVTLIVK